MNVYVLIACCKKESCIYTKLFKSEWQMPPLYIQNINHEFNMALLHVKFMFTFYWEYHWTFFSSIACNSTVASNKQRQEKNNLATIQRAKLKGAHEHSKSL